jgi:hypothetical protein
VLFQCRRRKVEGWPHRGPPLFFVNRIKDVSVVLQNTAEKAMIGYSVRWEYKSLTGRMFTRGVVRDNMQALLDAGRPKLTTKQPSSGQSIEPGAALLVSVFAGVGRSEPDIIRNWRTEYIDDIASLADGSVETSAVLDGIMFEDGGFAGPNKNQLFETVLTAFDAVQDVYRRIVTMAEGRDLEVNMICWARSQSSEPTVGWCEEPNWIGETALLDRGMAAEHFLRVHDDAGLDAAVDFARSQLYSQRPQFRRLGW